MLERTAEQTEYKESESDSCAQKSRHSFWRDYVYHAWSHPRKKALWMPTSKESYYDHLRSKAQKRYGCRAITIVERTKVFPRLFLPAEINSLREAIEKSRYILELRDNWDDAGSIGYSESTWNRAQSFLMRNALKLWRAHKMRFDAPRILPGPEGSIDLHWKTADRELLINVPARARESIAYYGDDIREGTENAIRGKDLESSTDGEWIFLWLMK
jgi:hypothetical protein